MIASAVRRLAALALALVEIPCPECGEYYDPADPAASYPHNNH